MPAAIARTRASSTGSDTPSADLTKVTVTASLHDADEVMAGACAVVGSGCAERSVPQGMAFDFWVAPGRAEQAVARLRELPQAVEVTTAAEGSEWREAMRTFHQPIEVAGRLRVRPPWQPPVAGLLDVVIDPGMAFGTGQHATTRTCLEFLVDLPPGPLVDIGCGSGVLAIAARRLGHDPVWAVDFDPLCVQATLANARVNGVALTVAERTIGRDPLPAALTVMANLTATVLGMLAEAMAGAPPQRAVFSGLRPDEVEPTLARWASTGLRLRDRRDDDGWSTILVGR
jgi:ribosomal protein L11 methyltransferase